MMDRESAAAAASCLHEAAGALNRLAAHFEQLAQPELPDEAHLVRSRLARAINLHGVTGAICGCSHAAICEAHAAARPRNCVCSGPWFRSSECKVAGHADEASLYPELDPARVG